MSVSSNPRRFGFTLVELLVVIGIIALLIGILLPTLNQARTSAVLVTCQSNVRQLGVGLVMYANDNNGGLPAAQRRGIAPGGGIRALTRNETVANPAFFWGARWSRDYLALYMMPDMEFQLNQNDRGWPQWQEVAFNSYFTCPRGLQRRSVVVSGIQNPWKAGYSFNGLVGVDLAQWNQFPAPGDPVNNVNIVRGDFRKFTNIQNSAETMLLVESENEAEEAWRMLNGTTEAPFTQAGFMHGDKNTISYADGHGAVIEYDDLPNPDTTADDYDPMWSIFWLGEDPN